MTNWYGTDFNPAQAGYAQQLAEASGANAKLYDESFAEFCNRPDLPQFDFIGMHGIWSWVSDENRRIITDFLRRKLKVGGVLYVSYNTQPGWAAMAPMRDLLVEHAELMGAQGHGIVPRIDSALEFAGKLVSGGARYGVANPGVAARLDALKGQNRNYLAHEYFNRDWEPMSFSKMSRWLDDAKLSFACSAHLLDHVDAINMPAEQQILKDIPDRSFRETVRDFLVNQQFRRDYWVRGLRQMSALERAEKLRAQRFIMVAVREEITLKVSGAIGEAALHENVYVPILDLLADLRVHTLHDVERALEGKTDFNGVLQALMILAGKGCIQLVQERHDDQGGNASSQSSESRTMQPGALLGGCSSAGLTGHRWWRWREPFRTVVPAGVQGRAERSCGLGPLHPAGTGGARTAHAHRRQGCRNA